MLQLTLNPGLTLTGFRTTRPSTAAPPILCQKYVQTLHLVNYTAKVGQDNVNIGVVTIFRLANTSVLQVYLHLVLSLVHSSGIFENTLQTRGV